jgi:hypothetical protein
MIKSIRIYPLSTEEFSDNCDVKCYFIYGLKEQNGKFYYRKKSINAEIGTIVLFQYEQHIVAQAELLEVCKLEEPKIENSIEYHGYFLFNLDTVYYYNKAFSAKKFYKIYPDKPLSRVMHILDDEEKNTLLLQKLSEFII